MCNIFQTANGRAKLMTSGICTSAKCVLVCIVIFMSHSLRSVWGQSVHLAIFPVVRFLAIELNKLCSRRYETENCQSSLSQSLSQSLFQSLTHPLTHTSLTHSLKYVEGSKIDYWLLLSLVIWLMSKLLWHFECCKTSPLWGRARWPEKERILFDTLHSPIERLKMYGYIGHTEGSYSVHRMDGYILALDWRIQEFLPDKYQIIHIKVDNSVCVPDFFVGHITLRFHVLRICFLSALSMYIFNREGIYLNPVKWDRFQNIQFQAFDVQTEVIHVGLVQSQEDWLQWKARHSQSICRFLHFAISFGRFL